MARRGRLLHAERASGLWLGSIRPSTVVMMRLLRGLQQAKSAVPGRSAGCIKRGVDVTLAVCALVVLAPMLLFLAVLIRAATGSSPIFAHERVGFGGRSFRCFKFRTMKLEADEILKQHLATNPQAAEEWEQTRKLMHDPRINCLGNVLRKSSIDELPQLINVLKGDMSLGRTTACHPL